jgi:hypothetical protein
LERSGLLGQGAHVGRLQALGPLGDVELHHLPLVQGPVALRLDE